MLEDGGAAAEGGARRLPGAAGHGTDLPTCNALCWRVHGHDRNGELRDAIRQGNARVVEHLGRITAYASEIAFFGHAVAETNLGLEALTGAAPGFDGGGFLLPTRNGELFRWCLEHGLRLVHQMTLMTIGLDKTSPTALSALSALLGALAHPDGAVSPQSSCPAHQSAARAARVRPHGSRQSLCRPIR